MKLLKRILKILLLIVAVVMISIQFIQPARNTGQVLDTDLTRIYPIPENVTSILKTSCYDCHSNNTTYPWYSFIQPGAWYMANHIKKGKAKYNFSEFGTYSVYRQQSKLAAIVNSIKDEKMPIPQYTLLHKDAKLSSKERKLLFEWIETIQDSLAIISGE